MPKDGVYINGPLLFKAEWYFDSFRFLGESKRRAMVFNRSITFDGEETDGALFTPEIPLDVTTEERSLHDRLRSGDELAFEQLVDTYSNDVFSLLYRLTDDPEEARDLSQDTFIRVLRSIESFRGDASLKTWIFRIAINESRNRHRWWKRRRRSETVSLDLSIGESGTSLGDMIADRSISPEESALSNERLMAIEEALGKISAKYREAVVLCDVQELSYEEATTALDIRIGTLKSRLARGREELRKLLKDI